MTRLDDMTMDLKTNTEPSVQPKEFFNQQWKTYQKVLNNNYMGHREIYSVLHELLLRDFKKPFRMLELGCGDASFTSIALLNTTIAAYKGIDLSEVALEIAQSNMIPIPCEKTFYQGDFSELSEELVSRQEDSFDVIMTSFALHHLSIEQKNSLIEKIAGLLTWDGIFILIDIVRPEGEEREVYIRRYLDEVQKSWSNITPPEYLMVENHISSSDFPETQHTLYQLALNHHFSRVECLYRDPLDTTQLLCFYR